MTSYWRMHDLPDGVRGHAVDTMKGLRRYLHSTMPTRTVGKSLVLGTWNIRNFDDNRFGFGPRLDESYFYLAEAISAFDIVAVQEINDSLKPLERLLKVLGPQWDFVVTDVTHSKLGGNDERLGFLYDKCKMSFRGVAGEIVLPDNLLISGVTKKRQFARTPFCCAFQAGWFKFMFATVHIYYGKDSPRSPEYKQRVSEIESIAKWLAARAKEESFNYVLVGDFNIDEFGSAAGNALEQNGFTIFKNKEGSNAKQTKFYDQISFCARERELRLAKSERAHGVLRLYDVLFADDMIDKYQWAIDNALSRQELEAHKKLASSKEADRKAGQKQLATVANAKTNPAARLAFYQEWRTYQISDHLPLWVELDIDFTDEYLDRVKAGQPRA